MLLFRTHHNHKKLTQGIPEAVRKCCMIMIFFCQVSGCNIRHNFCFPLLSLTTALVRSPIQYRILPRLALMLDTSDGHHQYYQAVWVLYCIGLWLGMFWWQLRLEHYQYHVYTSTGRVTRSAQGTRHHINVFPADWLEHWRRLSSNYKMAQPPLGMDLINYFHFCHFHVFQHTESENLTFEDNTLYQWVRIFRRYFVM